MTSEFLSIDGTRLEARRIAPAVSDAPTIVMLHEGLGSVGLWGNFPAALAEATGWGVFLYSRAGYGRSDPALLPRPTSYLDHEATKVLPQVLEAIGFERGILLGHSDGASIATIYAGSHQDHRIRGLVLIAPHFFVEDVSVAAAAEARAAYETGDLKARLARHHDDVENAFRGWNDVWLDPRFRTWDIQEAIGYIRVPILIVQGSRDQYGTVEQLRSAEEESYCPVEVRLLDDAGHAPHLDQPEAVLRSVTDFVRNLEAFDGRP
ncbi:MAG: alpha/beta hydrolase [Gemmatimonadetes bacterium]|nr:alpha/beta hydrolase [Gemmatimonadota bacterium]